MKEGLKGICRKGSAESETLQRMIEFAESVPFSKIPDVEPHEYYKYRFANTRRSTLSGRAVLLVQVVPGSWDGRICVAITFVPQKSSGRDVMV